MSAGRDAGRPDDRCGRPSITPRSGAAGVVSTLVVVRLPSMFEGEIGERAADIDGKTGRLHPGPRYGWRART